MQPEFDFKGLLADKGKVRMWISDDPRHICTRLQVKAPLATVKIILVRVFGPGDDKWTKTMEEEELGEDDEKEENEDADWDREKEKKEEEEKKEKEEKKKEAEPPARPAPQSGS